MLSNDHLRCEQLIDSYVTWLRKGVSVHAEPGFCEITTPFLDRHNDAIQIYVEEKNGTIRLSDDSYTIRDLRSTGFELTTSKRRALLATVLNGFSVHLVDDELVVKATTKDFAQKKHNLIQAILAVNDLFALSEPHVLSFFKEDVGFYLQTSDIQHFHDLKLSGKSGFDHNFDFALPKTKSRPERVLEAVNNLNKDQAATLAWAATDVKAVRQEQLEVLVFINDVVNPPSPDNVNALRAYDITPLMWSERHQALPLLRNGSSPS